MQFKLIKLIIIAAAEAADQKTVDDDNKSDSEYEYEYEEIEVEVDEDYEQEIVDKTGKVLISEGQCSSSYLKDRYDRCLRFSLEISLSSVRVINYILSLNESSFQLRL